MTHLAESNATNFSDAEIESSVVLVCFLHLALAPRSRRLQRVRDRPALLALSDSFVRSLQKRFPGSQGCFQVQRSFVLSFKASA